MRAPVILLTGEPLDIAGLQHPSPAGSGAAAQFIGTVRGGDGLTGLELLHHPVLTRRALERIGETAMARFALNALTIAHRHGRMAPGDPIVFISASAPHRRAAIDAMSFAIDVVKTETPFWKREWRGQHYDWIEPGEADHDAAARWLEDGR